jgi:hypothetical protein
MTEQHIDWSEHDVACAQAVLRHAPGDEFGLPTLTDEEIVGLDGIERPQVVALPWLEQHAEHKELACNVALRTLLSKGLAYPVVHEGQRTPSGLAAREDITGIMALRRLGQRIITAELTRDSGQVWLYGYVHQDQVLEELVDPSGTHSFTVTPLDQFADRVLQLADAANLPSEDGEQLTLRVPEFEARAPELLAGTLGVTVVTGTGLDPDDFRHFTLYTSADALFGLRSRLLGGESVLDVGPISRATAVGRLRWVIGQETA